MANEEHTYYTSGTIKVTKTRFIVGEDTYPMSGITSVRINPNYQTKLALIVGIILWIVVWIGTDNMFLGVLAGIAGGAGLFMTSSKVSLMTGSAGAEKAPLSYPIYRKAELDEVKKAINEAIIDRG